MVLAPHSRRWPCVCGLGHSQLGQLQPCLPALRPSGTLCSILRQHLLACPTPLPVPAHPSAPNLRLPHSEELCGRSDAGTRGWLRLAARDLARWMVAVHRCQLPPWASADTLQRGTARALGAGQRTRLSDLGLVFRPKWFCSWSAPLSCGGADNPLARPRDGARDTLRSGSAAHSTSKVCTGRRTPVLALLVQRPAV